MKDFIKEHKKLCILVGVLFAVIFIIYLFAVFRTGYWYRDVFLYKQKAPFDGMEVYSGHDAVNSADYELTMAKDGIKTFMAFTVNETERSYEIISDNSESHNPAVTIFENGDKVFTGTYRGFYLEDESGQPFEPLVSVEYGPYVPTEEELFPSYNWLYSVSQQKNAIRGNLIFLPAIIIIIAVVVFDMMYPDFFWQMRNCLDVEGGRPSGYFRFMQKLSWKISPFIIIALMIASFVVKI
ncbi:MAG: hypothetical protein IKL47_12570 [Clostridia bacterium]|nr:hypothetical protein [Clostridia bacterium]